MNNQNNNEFNHEEVAKNFMMQWQATYQNIKDLKEMHQEVRVAVARVEESESNIKKVGEFMIGFYNEYREHDALTTAQAKEIKEAQHIVTSTITRILAPTIQESRERGSEYLVIWNRVNKGIWSIFKRNVNGVNIPYDRTPKIKFNQALEYLKSLNVADYLAYREARWNDIKKFEFDESMVEEKLTIEKLIGSEVANRKLLT